MVVMTEKNNSKIILEIPAIDSIIHRLEQIENKLEDLASKIENQHLNKAAVSDKKMMTLNEVSKVYGIGLSSLRKKAAFREIPITKIGRRVYVRIEEFEKWLDKRKIKVF